MKKYLFVFTILLALGFISNTLSAQLTVSSITVNNNTGCALTVYPGASDLTCTRYCDLGSFNVNPNSSVAIPFPCADMDALAGGFFTIVRVLDNAAGAGGKVANGCGMGLSTTYIDCQGFTRTITLNSPNTVTIQ